MTNARESPVHAQYQCFQNWVRRPVWLYFHFLPTNRPDSNLHTWKLHHQSNSSTAEDLLPLFIESIYFFFFHSCGVCPPNQPVTSVTITESLTGDTGLFTSLLPQIQHSPTSKHSATRASQNSWPIKHLKCVLAQVCDTFSQEPINESADFAECGSSPWFCQIWITNQWRRMRRGRRVGGVWLWLESYFLKKEEKSTADQVLEHVRSQHFNPLCIIYSFLFVEVVSCFEILLDFTFLQVLSQWLFQEFCHTCPPSSLIFSLFTL